MPGTWRLRKKKAQSCYSKSGKHRDVQRSKSNKDISLLTTTPTPRRTATIIGGVPVIRSKSDNNLNAIISPEHHVSKRRPLLVHQSQEIIDDFELDFSPSELCPNLITVIFDNGHKSFERTRMAQETMSLQNILTMICFEQGIEIANDFSTFSVTALDKNGTHCIVDLNAPSTNYVENTIEVRLNDMMLYSDDSTTCPEKMTVQFCLDFFDSHGITDIPCGFNEIDNSSHLPLVQTTEPISESSWEDLPIDPDLKQSLDSRQLAQQQALWELIHTEHSFLRQLEIIINIYMRSLELIRRQDLLTEVNYHNIFGYMEEIHCAHKNFWLSTLSPCLERVYMENGPLDVYDVIDNFPLDFAQDFEIYEQHCVFETTNLRSLNEAMKCANFRAYVKWCESQPECNRLRLKDFLAIPRQRLMKYQLLFKAILKKTSDQDSIDDLKQIMDSISNFVDSVNNVLKTQEESSRIEEVMKKITGYSPVEVPGDLKDLVQPHTHLDLMAPMPDVDVTKTRILVLEGNLRFRDQKDKMVVHVFLFSDMLLITKPTVKRNVENYIVVRPPFKISNIQITLRGDAICCIVLSEFKVLSALFTLKAHSPSIAKEWVDQITSAQDFYNSALTKKVPTWHILDSLRQERILHGVSQDNDSGDTKVCTGSPLSSFHRVASNDSLLSNNSSCAFPFDVKATPLITRRRGTIPCSYSSSDTSKIFRRNSNIPGSPPWLSNASGGTTRPTHPIWQRTASLNALPERKMPQKNHSSPPKLQRNSATEFTSHSFQRASSLDLLRLEEISQLKIDPPLESTCPMLEEAIPLQESDSNTDDEDQYAASYSTVNSVFSPPAVINDPLILPTLRRHRRHKSQPTVSYIINTSTTDLTTPKCQSESDDSSYSFHRIPVHRLSDYDDDTLASSESSLMNDIIQELSKTNTEVSTKFQEELETSNEIENTLDNDIQIIRQRSMSLHSSVGNLEKRFHTRRKAIQLDNIFEITDEENDHKYSCDKKTESSHFMRNTKLRRSKSSFELSFHRRLKPPSPLTTHMKRSSETISDHPLLHGQISSPLLSHRETDTSLAITTEAAGQSEESAKPKNQRKHSLDDRRPKKLKDKKTLSFSFFKKGKSLSPTHSKWGFKSLKKFSALSMEAGLDRTANIESPLPPPSPPPPSPPPSVHPKVTRTRKYSPKVMLVVASQKKKT